VKIVRCDRTRHLDAILAILNDAIVNSTALYDYQPRTAANMVQWFDAKEQKDFPVIGVEDESGALMGFASYGTFRAWPAYKYSVEHSVYVEAAHRGKGLGRVLLEALIAEAQRQDYHTLVGGIDAANRVSIRLHESLGFTACGVIRESGFKFGRWLDLAFYQLILRTPSTPVDG
jgi:L-amino acid N-acyltransferase